jgi:hypothetical protein
MERNWGSFWVKFLNSKLLNLYHRRPVWAISLYYKLPLSIQNLIHQKILELEPADEVKKLKKLGLFPLDSAWAEVIFAPFHDPEISPTLPVEFELIKAQGCKIDFSWCWTVLSWAKCPEQEDAAFFNLITDIELLHYDGLIICLTISEETSVRFEIKHNNEWKVLGEGYRGTGKRMEIVLPVEKGILNEVRLYFKSDTSLSQSAQISWFGLQNSDLVQRMREHKLEYSHKWPGLIKPVNDWGPVKFEIGLVFNELELGKLREKKRLAGWDNHFQLLEGKAREYLRRQPENDLSDYLPLNDSRYLRENELGKTPYYFEALVLGFVGLVNQDKEMMVHALRYLMCMVHTRNWAQSGESRLSGSSWDQRCFLEEMATTSVSLLSDWFAFALTDRAKDLIRQSIWDKGLAIIERDMMKYEYLYHINQGAVFCRARILGGLYLERSWPRVGKYVERAFSDMTQCLKRYIEKDGGTHEGIGYFCQTLQAVIPATIAYAQSRGKTPKKYIKKYFSNCENYVATMSGSIPGTAIVEGDCRTNYFCGDVIPVLAGFFPGGVCEKILGSCIATGNIFAVTGTLSNSGGIIGFVYGPDKIVKSECVVPTFSILHKSGHLASFRKQRGHSVRFQMTGSKPNPSHSHFDKGAIALEIDNEPVLIDRGMVEYYFSQANELKRSCMHNVITPFLPDGTYPDQEHPTEPVIPSGHGNKQALNAHIDLTNVWGNYMIKCSRSIQSKTPDEFLIVDGGELREEGCVAFHLHSTFPFEIEAKKIIVRNNNAALLIEALWAEDILCRQESINLRHEPVYHLMIHSPASKQFMLKTKIERIT